MASSRYVLLGLAPARADWFRDVGQWANTGSIPADFLKTVSAGEVRARLASGRVFSALLVDGTTPGLDRDLIERARDVGCAVVVVGGSRTVQAEGARSWLDVGASAHLLGTFDRKDLLDALASCASMVGRADRAADEFEITSTEGWQAPLLAVTGSGGAGVSTAAIALAQGIASDVRESGSVLLADLRLRAEHAVLHDVGDVVPGVQELVDAFRTGSLSSEEVRALTFDITERGYALLLGLRKRSAWATIRPRSFEAALEGLRSAFRTVIADVDSDLEGEEQGGSIDVEERNIMARTACSAAHAVVVVGHPGAKGVHALAETVAEILGHGVTPARIIPVVNRAPRQGRQRAEMTQALVGLLPPWAVTAMPTAVFVPERRVDEAMRDGVRLPESIVRPIVGAYHAVESRITAVRPTGTPELVRPGTLGAWTPLTS
ncbi:MAG: hypothetical protein NVS3B21_06740 [Acidimicrobiales bacterium]